MEWRQYHFYGSFPSFPTDKIALNILSKNNDLENGTITK